MLNAVLVLEEEKNFGLEDDSNISSVFFCFMVFCNLLSATCTMKYDGILTTN